MANAPTTGVENATGLRPRSFTGSGGAALATDAGALMTHFDGSTLETNSYLKATVVARFSATGDLRLELAWGPMGEKVEFGSNETKEMGILPPGRYGGPASYKTVLARDISYEWVAHVEYLGKEKPADAP
ncbi:MAG: hypothetical protein HY556_03195 [Euryarchaeota archaeon]|nr:hypothetical protein [Euryarchaeota archaeon]